MTWTAASTDLLTEEMAREVETAELIALVAGVTSFQASLQLEGELEEFSKDNAEACETLSEQVAIAKAEINRRMPVPR